MRIAFIAVTALLLGTCAPAQEITCDYSKADFAHFKTYAWASGHRVADELANQSIVNSIDAQTVGQRADEGQPQRGAKCTGLLRRCFRPRHSRYGFQGRFAEPALEERF